MLFLNVPKLVPFGTDKHLMFSFSFLKFCCSLLNLFLCGCQNSHLLSSDLREGKEKRSLNYLFCIPNACGIFCSNFNSAYFNKAGEFKLYMNTVSFLTGDFAQPQIFPKPPRGQSFTRTTTAH